MNLGDSCASLENHINNQANDGKFVNGLAKDFEDEDKFIESALGKGISKSETIGAISSYLNSIDDNFTAQLCRKCGHFVKQQ